MLGLPFRIASTIAVALFLSSKWVRRGVAAVIVSAIIVAERPGGLEPADSTFLSQTVDSFVGTEGLDRKSVV